MARNRSTAAAATTNNNNSKKKRKKKELTDEERAAKLLKNDKEKEEHLRRILEANAAHLKASTSSAPPIVPPERKPFSTINELALVTPGDRVAVVADTSPGKNRPEGRGYVTEVNGVGADAVMSIKYDEVSGGLLHHGIPFEDVTVVLFGAEFLQKSVADGRGKRTGSPTTVMDPPVEEVDDGRPAHVQLLDTLADGCRRRLADGWYRKQLGLYAKGPDDFRLSELEKAKLYSEILMLESN